MQGQFPTNETRCPCPERMPTVFIVLLLKQGLMAFIPAKKQNWYIPLSYLRDTDNSLFCHDKGQDSPVIATSIFS